MNGRKLYVRPATTAIHVLRMRPSGSRCRALSVLVMMPSSARIVFQAYVRSRKEANDGAMTSTSISERHRPARKAMK